MTITGSVYRTSVARVFRVVATLLTVLPLSHWMPQTTSTSYFFNMPYSSVNSYHTGLGVHTFGTDTITRQAKPSWVVARKEYHMSQEVTRVPVDAVEHH